MQDDLMTEQRFPKIPSNGKDSEPIVEEDPSYIDMDTPILREQLKLRLQKLRDHPHQRINLQMDMETAIRIQIFNQRMFKDYHSDPLIQLTQQSGCQFNSNL
jgi:hypothetical protein